MNTSYRSVYNEALGAWVATSEISTARGKRSSSGATLVAALVATAALGGSPFAWAANECGVEASGADTIDCAAAAYPAGISYTNSDGLTLNLGDAGITAAVGGAQVMSSASNTNTVTVNALSFGSITTGTAPAVYANNAGTAGDGITAMGGSGTITTTGSGGYGMYSRISNPLNAGTASVSMVTVGTINTAGSLAAASGPKTTASAMPRSS